MEKFGVFITFEGGEGSGKSTQCQLLANLLNSHGKSTIVSREPGGSPLAERIRKLLLSGTFKECGADVEAVMFAAARSDHFHKTILPAISNGQNVICDRFFDSTSVYQSISSGVDVEFLSTLRYEAVGDRSPDLTVILDVPTEISFSRAKERRQGAVADRFEAEGLEFHKAVRDGFLRISEAEPSRCVVIDGVGNVEEVHGRVVSAVSTILGLEMLRPAF